MPRPATDIYWRERIKYLAANNPKMSDRAITKQLDKEAQDIGRSDQPRERTVGRIRKAFATAPEEQRKQYQTARWPDSMVGGGLAWEASAALLELLGHLRRHLGPNVASPIGLANWFWRVTQAAPDAPIISRVRMAIQFASWDLAGWPVGAERFEPESYLAQAPWRSNKPKDASVETDSASPAPEGIYWARIDTAELDVIPIVYVDDDMQPTGLIIKADALLPYLAQRTPREVVGESEAHSLPPRHSNAGPGGAAQGSELRKDGGQNGEEG